MRASNISIRKQDLEFIDNQEDLNKEMRERNEQERAAEEARKAYEEKLKQRAANDLFVSACESLRYFIQICYFT